MTGQDTVLGIGLLTTTFAFGLRHGIDWDHIAAITDIVSSQDDRRRSLGYSTLYALGHAAVVFALGTVVIAFSGRLPTGIDDVMERLVGVTLVLLGVYVFYALARDGRQFRLRSRWMLIFSGLRRGARWSRARLVEVVHDHEHAVEEPHPDAQARQPAHVGVRATTSMPQRHWHTHRHTHRHVAALPDDPFTSYGRATSFGVGMIHGVGAETPTQVVLFLTAAGVGGAEAGLLLLAVFLVGLLVSNTVVAVAAAAGFLSASRSFPVYATISVVVGVFSLAVGVLFVLGRGAVLPVFLGG